MHNDEVMNRTEKVFPVSLIPSEKPIVCALFRPESSELLVFFFCTAQL